MTLLRVWLLGVLFVLVGVALWGIAQGLQRLIYGHGVHDQFAIAFFAAYIIVILVLIALIGLVLSYRHQRPDCPHCITETDVEVVVDHADQQREDEIAYSEMDASGLP